MGMFDTVKFKNLICPKCKKQIEDCQTKQFGCYLAEWELGSLFMEHGKVDGLFHFSIQPWCGSTCDWSGVLEATVQDNIITEFRGVNFEYSEKIENFKDYVRDVRRQKQHLDQEKYSLGTSLKEVLFYILSKEPDKKEIIEELVKDLPGTKWEDLKGSLSSLNMSKPLLVGLYDTWYSFFGKLIKKPLDKLDKKV